MGITSSSLHFHTLPFGYQFKRGQGDPLPVILKDVEDWDETDDSEERALLCKFCRKHITSMDKATQVQDSHQHIFTNPAGDRFRIGCFASAPGCKHSSPPTMEFTWFKGFSWQVALCANCQVQMGWFYQSADATHFYGLILNHLIEGS
jgi:hypothetical protein